MTSACRSVVVTFDPHPSEVVRPGSHPPVLTPVWRKAELIEELGVDAFCVLPFTTEFSRLPAGRVRARACSSSGCTRPLVVVGENFRFGHKAAGDSSCCVPLGSRFGFSAEGVGMLARRRRDALLHVRPFQHRRRGGRAGRRGARPAAPGRRHRGARRGSRPAARLPDRQRRAPTAHIAVPADGIYAGWAVLHRKRLPAAISVGTNPTFEGRQRTVEAYILDFDEDIYGVELGVEFVERLRGMVKFDSVERARRADGPGRGTGPRPAACKASTCMRWYPVRHAPPGAV